MKYKVGDRVKVRSWNQMVNEYGVNQCGDIKMKPLFINSMREYCEKIVTIKEVCGYHYCIKEDCGDWFWSDDMFDIVEKNTTNVKTNKEPKTTKELGKITFAEYETIRDYPFLIGLKLGFSMSGTSIMDGEKYTVNISPECKWGILDREATITKSVEEVNRILEDAKVNYVSELLNKPVEVTMENNTFKDFRILTEVL